MVKVSIIGKGKFGSKIHQCIKDNVKFVEPNDADWIIISTPNDLHSDQVETWLSKKKNVFCEKPLTLTESTARGLFSLADFFNVKLYVDDVFSWYDNIKIEDDVNFKWYKYGSFNANIIDNLAYHHFYLWTDTTDFNIDDVIVNYQDSNKCSFEITLDNGKVGKFDYDITSDNPQHSIDKPNNNPLQDMLLSVFENSVDFEANKKRTLNAIKLSERVKRDLFPTVLVVGGGIFGCTAAWKLAKEGYDVTLYEKNDDIISQASYVNQYRLHRGYHYPRSKETAEQSQWGEHSFLQEYGDAIVNGDIEHYYAIAKEDSLVSSEEYKEFLDDLSLEYKKKTLDIVNKNSIDLVVKVNELLFDPNKLKKICWDKLKQYNVDVMLDTEYISSFENYDYVINSTYANLNQLTPEDKQRDFQFELCEKPVIKLPKQYKNKSVVIMDGPFMCIDPLGDTDYHVMGNVVHAIHSTNVGRFPEYDSKFNELLNKGIVKNPSITNIDNFVESAKKFFIDIDKLEHIGSMYTIRTVLPNKDKDDARPTLVEKPTDNMFNIFSGKIGTCVTAADDILEFI